MVGLAGPSRAASTVGLLVRLLRAPPLDLAAVAQHQGDLVDGLDRDVVDLRGQVGGQRGDDERALAQRLAAGVGGGLDAGQVGGGRA